MAEPRRRIAVVGSGISGLASAWLLARHHDVTLIEAASRLGGHTHTVEVALEGRSHPVDTGFLVCNPATYPNLLALFDLVGVRTVASDMSFAVSLAEPALEWAGSSLATVFGQKANLARPAFWGMLKDILRFNRAAGRLAQDGGDGRLSLGEYLERGGYGRAFRDWYLLPMAAAIWSCPTGRMLAYPAMSFARFCRNHGLLQIFDRPRWLTVEGGGRTYVQRLAADLPDIRLATRIARLRREAGAVWLTGEGIDERYDALVLACHSDQALELLGGEASAEERAILGAIRYQPNRAVLHTDAALLPRDRALWSAWNYVAGGGDPENAPVSVSYLLNRLQPLPFATPVIVSLNPVIAPRPDSVIGQFDYEHPLFDLGAIAAQERLSRIQGVNRTWFCGAWTGYGFHEDGLKSAMAVAEGLGVEIPWCARARAGAREAS